MQIHARIIDHACSSAHSISQQIVDTFHTAHVRTVADLSNTQPVDACGYIAADAVTRLFQDALSDSGGIAISATERTCDAWMNAPLPDYATAHCIHRGSVILDGRASDQARVLEADDVNRLVRHYAFLDTRLQASEEWWGGAVALNNFFVGVDQFLQELQAAEHDKQHNWRSWVVNTHCSGERGSHWFTVALGRRSEGDAPEALLQSALQEHCQSDSSSPPAPSAQSSQLRATTESPGFDFTALFPTPNAATLAALNWAHGHTSDPDVAAWILFCNGLNQAVLAKSNLPQVKRQKLCQAAGISFTRQMKEATTDTLCQEQGKRICEIHQAKKFFCAVSRKRAAPESPDEMETTEPALPVRITNVSSAWLRIRTIPDADHWDLQKLKKVIDGLRYRCTSAGLDRLLEDDRKKTFKTLLQKLQVTQYVSFRLPPSLGHDTATTADEQGHQTAGAQPAAKPKAKARPQKKLELSWRVYHVKLRAIAQAFQWLPAPERKDAIDSPQQTPRTVFQLATDIKDAGTLLLTPFGHDFEEIYGPTTSRLLAYAELPRHRYGSFEEPLETMPFVYRDLQELILEQRRSVAEPNDTQAAGAAEPSSQRDQKSDDLACLLQDFTRDLCTTYFLVHFAFPPRRAEEAADVTLAAEPSGAATPPPLTPCDATERAGYGDAALDAAAEHAPSAAATPPSVTSCDATEHAGNGDAALDASAEHAEHGEQHLGSKPANTANNTRPLNASLSPAAAKDMVAKFTEFLTDNRLLPRVQHISAGHLMVLCIFHARLSWQKGPPIELTSRDKYWIPKPTYTPASRVQAPSPPFFVQQIQAFATEHGSPRIQPPRTCVLCGKGFVDRAALWRHCEAEHHSWVEARKRIFWEAEQLDALPLLPADKRRLTQNFAFAQTHSRPGESHFGQNKVCMKQRVGCAVCALVDFIDACFPCYLFKECPEPLQKHTSTGDEENASDSDGSDEDRMTAKERRRRGPRLRDEEGYYVIRAA